MGSHIVDINGLFQKHFLRQEKLREIIRIHSEQVARKALEIIRKRQLPADREFVYCGALLHDIGVVNCSAPEIHAFGPKPYICHGVEGRKILEKNGLPLLGLICERHTGSGITKNQIIEGNLPLPQRDMLPVTLEEKIICYSDKFFSKSKNMFEEKSVEKIINQMEKHGKEAVDRFLELHSLFS